MPLNPDKCVIDVTLVAPSSTPAPAVWGLVKTESETREAVQHRIN